MLDEERPLGLSRGRSEEATAVSVCVFSGNVVVSSEEEDEMDVDDVLDGLAWSGVWAGRDGDAGGMDGRSVVDGRSVGAAFVVFVGVVGMSDVSGSSGSKVGATMEVSEAVGGGVGEWVPVGRRSSIA